MNQLCGIKNTKRKHNTKSKIQRVFTQKGKIMKFIKGMFTGMIITVGAMYCYEECNFGKCKMMKNSKKMLKKIGIL